VLRVFGVVGRLAELPPWPEWTGGGFESRVLGLLRTLPDRRVGHVWDSQSKALGKGHDRVA
jgi:hypothetical protein